MHTNYPPELYPKTINQVLELIKLLDKFISQKWQIFQKIVDSEPNTYISTIENISLIGELSASLIDFLYREDFISYDIYFSYKNSLLSEIKNSLINSSEKNTIETIIRSIYDVTGLNIQDQSDSRLSKFIILSEGGFLNPLFFFLLNTLITYKIERAESNGIFKNDDLLKILESNFSKLIFKLKNSNVKCPAHHLIYLLGIKVLVSFYYNNPVSIFDHKGKLISGDEILNHFNPRLSNHEP